MNRFAGAWGDVPASSGDVEGLLDEAVVSPTIARVGGALARHSSTLARATAYRFLGSFDEEMGSRVNGGGPEASHTP